MRLFPFACLLGLACALPVPAQVGCPNAGLHDAAIQVASLRSELARQTVLADDPTVPPSLAQELGRLKDALALAADAAFRCATPGTTAEALERTLADALRANQALGNESPAPAPDPARDTGAYGADLGVHIFQLSGTPSLFETDFRYRLECGDDHVLLIFEPAAAGQGWRESLRWQAGSYSNVSEALGDFVTLAPLTHSYRHPSWHYVVAHGHPGCGPAPRPSRFDLDLLTPTADPAKPHVDWHFEHAYLQGETLPRLATTEDTLEFRLSPLAAEGKAPPTAQPEMYRFHLDAQGQLVPSPAEAGEAAAPPADRKPAPSATSSSPR